MKPAAAWYAADIRALTCAIFFKPMKFWRAILNTHHNVYFYLDIMRAIREAIAFGNLSRFSSELQARLEAGQP